MTFEEVALEWLELHKLTISQATYSGYQYNLQHINSFIGDMEISSIKYNHLLGFLNTKVKEGYSKRTLVGFKNTINFVFKYAIKCEYISKNLAALLDLPRNLPPAKSIGGLTKHEIIKILQFQHRYQLFVLMLYHTGMRKGEALALKWSDVDFKNNLISVTKSLELTNNTSSIKLPKTDNGVRLIPIPKHFTRLLQSHCPASRNSYMFTQVSTGKLHTKSSYVKMWQRWLDDFSEYVKDEISPRRITAHMLRHTYATRLFEKGIPDLIIQLVMGHADAEFTKRRYTHIGEDYIGDNYEYIRCLSN